MLITSLSKLTRDQRLKIHVSQ